jgi:hypothetical protein
MVVLHQPHQPTQVTTVIAVQWIPLAQRQAVLVGTILLAMEMLAITVAQGAAAIRVDGQAERLEVLAYLEKVMLAALLTQ